MYMYRIIFIKYLKQYTCDLHCSLLVILVVLRTYLRNTCVHMYNTCIHVY